jgi:death on curing protein
MTTRYLTKEHIIAIHAELIKQFGGLQGVRDESLLESAVGRYQSGYYADVLEEAAALMESLGINHPFLDGNKRIAVTAPFVFLMANGYSVNLDEEQAFQLIVGALEQSDFTRGHLEKWIRDNAK